MKFCETLNIFQLFDHLSFWILIFLMKMCQFEVFNPRFSSFIDLSMLMYSFNLCRSLINFQLSKYYLKWKNWTDFFILSIYLSNVLFLNMKFTNHPFQPSSFSFMLCEPFDKKFSTWFKYKTSQVWSELFYIFYYLLISLIQIDKKYKT